MANEPNYKSERTVKDLIRKGNVEEFATNLYKMDRSVVEKWLPQMVDFSNGVISYLYDLCKVAMEETKGPDIEAYMRVLGDLSIKLNSVEPSSETFSYIIDKEMEISRRISELNAKNKAFKLQILGGFATFATSAAAIIASPAVKKTITKGVKNGAKVAARIVDNLKS